MVLPCAVSVEAGGALETFDITGRIPSPIAGQLMARIVPIRWDTRAIPVKYSMNSTQDPIPNPLGPAFLSLADATTALQESFDAWNDIRMSFIDMRIVGATSNPGLSGFDFVNELTFRTSTAFGAIAASPAVVLIEDTMLVEGDDIDEDGDADVSSAIRVTKDVDLDGDLEFPAGFYRAGSILDNDVQFNTKSSNGFRFTIDPDGADTDPRSVDLIAIAVHEFGHSHGLSHSVNNQTSGLDGTGATMFPIIDTGDPVAELSERTLSIDDISYSSFFYPEGTRRRGPAALRRNDVAFEKVFGLLKGELTHGPLAQPLAGGHIFAVRVRDGTASTSAISGTTRVSFDPVTGGLFPIPDPIDAIVDGKFVIPVPRGRYELGIEPVDGHPVSVTSISFAVQLGAIYGQQNFNEEFVAPHKQGDRFDDDLAYRGSDSRERLLVRAGETRRHLDLVTSSDINIDNFGDRNFIGFVGSPPGRMYAVRIPASQITDARQGRDILIKAVAFDTAVADASVVPRYAEATLTTGVVNPDGTVSLDLANPLVQITDFLGQDNDLAPLFFRRPRRLGRFVQRGIDSGEIQSLFVVLRIPSARPFPGVSGIPPLIGLDGIPGGVNDVPVFGLSFVSDDGGQTFLPVSDFNFRFSLRLGISPNRDHSSDEARKERPHDVD
jgi:hypothetical protein